MSKKAEEIQSKQSSEHENLNFSKTGYSNSRLDAHTVIAGWTHILCVYLIQN